MTDDDNSLQTFSDSEAFLSIYTFAYLLVILSIIFGAYYFASKVKLLYKSYYTLNQIEKHLGNISIIINAFENKINFDIDEIQLEYKKE